MSKTAFVFPGQGSQTVGMLADFAERTPIIRETFTEASDALGYDLWELVQNGPDDKLNQTEFTQPALLTSSVAIWRCAREVEAPMPDVVAGHSLGEYSALVAAGAITLADGASLVQRRGQYMQTAVPLGEGGMAAVLGLDDEQVVAICEASSTAESVVEAVNFNAPGQVVIAGANAAIERAVEALKAAGAKRAMPLAVSAPFHSSMMQPAADRMAEALDGIEISTPTIAIVQNVNAKFESDTATIKANLISQMCNAVLWTDSIRTMVEADVGTVVECGPGKVLAGLNKRIDKSIESWSLCDTGAFDKTREGLWS